MISLNDFVSTYNVLKKPLLIEAYVRKNAQYLSPEDQQLAGRTISMFNSHLCYGKNKELKLLLGANFYCFGDLYKEKLLYKRETLRPAFKALPMAAVEEYSYEYFPCGLIKSDVTKKRTISKKLIFKEKYYTQKYFIKNKFLHSIDILYSSPREYLGRAFAHNEEFFLKNVSFIQDNFTGPLRIVFRRSCKDIVGQFIKIMDADLFYKLVPEDNAVEVYASMDDMTHA